MALDFDQRGRLMKPAQQIDHDQVMKHSQKVDLGALLGVVARMGESTLLRMTKMLQSQGNGQAQEPPPVTEAIYSYEGTNEINALVVGRALTGERASL